MSEDVLTLQRFKAGLGTGDSRDRDPGTRRSGPRGVEAVFEYNGLYLNVRDWIDTYLVTNIDGFDDGDVRDTRDLNPGQHGETPGQALYGGRTIVLSGKIQAKTLWKLRDMQAALRLAFSDISQEYPLIIRTNVADLDMMIMCKKSQKINMPEAQTTANGFERPFQITLRASKPWLVSMMRIRQTFVTPHLPDVEPDTENLVKKPDFESLGAGGEAWGAWQSDFDALGWMPLTEGTDPPSGIGRWDSPYMVPFDEGGEGEASADLKAQCEGTDPFWCSAAQFYDAGVDNYDNIQAVTPGESYSVGAAFYIPTSSGFNYSTSTNVWVADDYQLEVRVTFLDDTGAQLDTIEVETATLSDLGHEQRVDGVVEAVADSAWAVIELRVSVTGPKVVGTTFNSRFDDVQFAHSSDIVDYFDGSMPGFKWTGEPHLSTSVYDELGISYDAIFAELTNEGDFEAYPTVEMTGPLTTFEMVNEANGLAIKLKTEFPVPMGETWILDLEEPAMYRQSDGENMYEALDESSDDLVLEPLPTTNPIRIIATGLVEDESQVGVVYRHTTI